MKKVQFVGLDVHAETIAVAVAEPGGVVRSVGVIPNRPESIRRLVKQPNPFIGVSDLQRDLAAPSSREWPVGGAVSLATERRCFAVSGPTWRRCR